VLLAGGYYSSTSNRTELYFEGARSAISINLQQAQRLNQNSFRFSFNNTPGWSFTALVSTNLGLPLTSWTALGDITEISPGQFQFTDPQATNSPRRFYRVRAN